MRIEVEEVAAAPPRAVWAVLTDWEAQPRWMVDARAVHVLTPDRTGTGVTLRCSTNVLGLVVDDVMRVTDWRPSERLEVVHLGAVIRGRGAFELSVPGAGGAGAGGASSGVTRITWWEEVDPPLGRAGDLGAELLVAPLVRRLFRRSLDNLVRLIETVADPEVPSSRVPGADEPAG